MTINKNTLPNTDTEKSEVLETQNILPQLAKAARLISQLQDVGIDPILYGSTGVSYYLGQF